MSAATPQQPAGSRCDRRGRRGAAPAARIQVVAVLALAGAAVAAAWQGWGTPSWWALPVLAVVVAAAEIAVVHLQLGRQRWTFSLTEGALGAAWVAAPGAWTAGAVVLGVVVAQLVRRQPRLKLLYNVAQFAAATSLGSVAAAAAGREVLGAAVGMVAFFAVNHGLVGVAVSVTTRRPLGPLLLSSAPLSAVHTAGNSSIGLLAAFLATTAPLGLLGLVVPLALLWTSYDQQTRRSAEVRLFAELARGQQRATGRSPDVSAQVVLTAAARLLGGADVEMVLLAADGPVRFCGDETGVPVRRRVDLDAFDAPWIVQALRRGAVSVGVEGGRPYVSAVVGDKQSPLAVLLARRPRGSGGFGRREARLVQVLVGQAETWLQVSALSEQNTAARAQVAQVQAAAGEQARALGELGAAAAPSLRVLRESAQRLVQLADRADLSAGVDDIVDELHLVERAVASLLGALALAAEPDLRRLGSPSGPVPGPLPAAAPAWPAALPGQGRPGGVHPHGGRTPGAALPPERPGPSEWTTTGVLQ